MSGAGVVVGALVGVVMLPLFFVVTTGTSMPPQVTTDPGGQLNTALVPPGLVGFVEQAGAMCPQESGPLIAAQIEAESGWDPTAQSPAGAQGIAQFMPGTWALWGADFDHNGTVSVFDPGDAIPAQGTMMCALFGQVNAAMVSGRITRGTAEENALAAYNCGLGNVLRTGGFPTGITETDAYVPRIELLKVTYTVAGGAGGGGVPAGPAAAAAIEAARRYLGYPYVWGGGDTRGPTGRLWSSAPPIGFDCEGLVRYAIFQGFQVDIGAGTLNQLSTAALTTVASRPMGAPDPLAQMQPGDVVVMNVHPSSDGAWGHVALYLGAGQFIHAPHTGAFVEIVPAADFARADWVVRRVP